jgi:D-alanyl-D-alanine dipeptidase
VSVDLYDNLAESYDLLISWKRRLRREKPFFRRVFKEFGVRRVLDTACGTGMHAIAFYDWGYHVVGADISEKMVEKARENAGRRQIDFVGAGFTDLDTVGGMFDAVTCLGNSLPHVLSDEELDKSLSCMFDVLLPGGVLIVHGNNYDRIIGRRERFMPPAHGKRDGREYLFVRFFDFHGDTLTFNVITLAGKSGEWQMHLDSSTHRALTRDLLVAGLHKAGFTHLRLYGGYPDERYEKMDSDNLIVVAQKPHTPQSRPPSEPVVAIDRVPIRESGEPLVDIAVAAPGIELRENPMFARKTVVEMLKKVQAALPKGCKLKVRTTLRSLDRQREIYESLCRQLAEKRPDWPESRIRREANKFLAPPDARHPPGHTTGGAVDVTIIGADGEEIDLSSTIKPCDSPMPSFPTYSRLITPRAAKNRQMLLDAMVGVGFSNYHGEWWHFSYGDSAWALRTGAPFALYGRKEP